MIYIIYTYDLSSVRVKVASSERKKSECCFCLKYELISAEFLFIVQTTQKTYEFSSKYLCQGSAEQSTVGSIRNIQNSFRLSPTGTIKRTAETWLLLAVYSMLSWKQIKQQKTQHHQQKQSQDDISVFMCIVCVLLYGGGERVVGVLGKEWGGWGWGGDSACMQCMYECMRERTDWCCQFFVYTYMHNYIHAVCTMYSPN